MTVKPVASRNSGTSENSEAGSRKWPYNFHVSPAVVPHMGKVYSIVRKIYGRSPTGDLNDLDVNTAVWGICMNVTLQTAVPLGQDCMENLRLTKNQLLKSVKQLFQVTEKLIEDQKEINNLTTIACKELTRAQTPLRWQSWQRWSRAPVGTWLSLPRRVEQGQASWAWSRFRVGPFQMLWESVSQSFLREIHWFHDAQRASGTRRRPSECESPV